MTIPQQVIDNIAAAQVLDALQNRAAQCIGREFKVTEIHMSIKGTCLAAVQTNIESGMLRSWLRDVGATETLIVYDRDSNVAEIMFKAAHHDG